MADSNDAYAGERELTLLDIISRLPPEGFERLCQHVLRKAGFSEVEVTGRSGDGGIDGQGILRVNEPASFRLRPSVRGYRGRVATGRSVVRPRSRPSQA